MASHFQPIRGIRVTTIGLDLAKQVFQIHGVNEAGDVVVKRRLRRAQVMIYFAPLPACLIGIGACATAHVWARELRSLGYEVRLMPPQYVKAYVKRGKNDAADAAAICEAVTRPSMRFVPVKTEEQQSALTMHRVRELLVRQRTQLINAVRGHLWLATGRTDMRRGMNELAIQVQETLRRDPHGGHLFVFRGSTTARACASSPSGWSADGSFGRPRRTE